MLTFRTRTKWYVRKLNTGTRFQLLTKRLALLVILFLIVGLIVGWYMGVHSQEESGAMGLLRSIPLPPEFIVMLTLAGLFDGLDIRFQFLAEFLCNFVDWYL